MNFAIGPAAAVIFDASKTVARVEYGFAVAWHRGKGDDQPIEQIVGAAKRLLSGAHVAEFAEDSALKVIRLCEVALKLGILRLGGKSLLEELAEREAVGRAAWISP